MKIFETIEELDVSKLHPKFVVLRDSLMLKSERNLLESWTNGMVDKDHKMVREFQESFHSCFWEFFLYYFFRKYGFEIDQSHQVPDFVVTAPYKFYVEAVVSNIRSSGKKEKERTIQDIFNLLLPPYLYKDFYSDLDEAITRHANSLQSKLLKYKNVYTQRNWVDKNIPYIIALSSYDQINYGREYIYSMMALLYGAYYNAVDDNYCVRDSIIKPGTVNSEIPIGLFIKDDTKEEYADVSAVIFSCNVTIGKLSSMIISKGNLSLNTVFNIRRYNNEDDEHGKYLIQEVSVDSPEHLADGVFIFHNPNAKNKLGENVFSGIPVTQFYIEDGDINISGNETPMIVRINTSRPLHNASKNYIVDCVRLYNRMTPEDFYEERKEEMLKVEKDFSLKQLVEEEGFVFVLDTNILLNIYRYSQDFSDFALKCLNSIKEYIYLPSIVRLEYGKHCRGAYSRMSNRIDIAKTNIQKQIDIAQKSVLGSLKELKRLQYPEIDNLSENLEKKFAELKILKDDFFDNRPVVDYVSHAWSSDLLMNIVNFIEAQKHVFPELTLQEIYDWDEQGEKRYKDNVPPGFMDAKDKKGVRKYSDFFIWKEILRFAQNHNKDVIFVTDDIKQDWWVKNQDQFSFHQQLLTEFMRTGKRIIPLISEKFYKEISSSFNVERIDSVELALNMTDCDYCKSVSERVFDSICDDLYYNAMDYINEATAHIGSEGIEEFDIIDHEYLNAERVDRDGNSFTYQFVYQIALEGTSYDYWGRDEDTKEIITSLGRNHVFEGTITVSVEREADIFIDVESADFESATIVDSSLEETNYEDREYLEKELTEVGELGICPDCGKPLSIENDGGNGFCKECAINH